MSTFKEALRKTTKIEWCICIGGICLFFFFYHFSHIPRYIIDPFFYGYTSSFFIYSIFFKKELSSIKNRLCNAMIGGAFIWMFIESLSKLFAKWAVWRFF
jgi:hypothetical protein